MMNQTETRILESLIRFRRLGQAGLSVSQPKCQNSGTTLCVFLNTFTTPGPETVAIAPVYLR